MTSLRESVAAAAAGAGCAALAVLVDAGIGPAAGEPLALRWVRAAADHPVRSAAAGACLFLALRPRAPRDPPGSEGDGGPPRVVDWPPTRTIQHQGLEREALLPAPPRPGPPFSESMASTVLVDVVRGPEDVIGFGRSLLLEPVQPTTRPDRYPTQAVIITNAARKLIDLSKAGERLDSIVVLGELDPTLHPEFVEISGNLRELCRKWFPKSQLVLFAHAPRFGDPLVRHALLAYHTLVLRLDTATQKTYRALTGREGGDLKTLLEHLDHLDHRNLVVRANFVRGTVDNSGDAEVKAWIKALAGAKPALVQLETPARQIEGLKPVTKTRLGEIAEQVAEKLGSQVELL